jgi:hypothetical protein
MGLFRHQRESDDGGFDVECDGPSCTATAHVNEGAPGPTDWLDLSMWRGSSADSVGYFCSKACLAEWVASE